MKDYKKLAEAGRLACVRSVDLLSDTIQAKKFLGQDTTNEKAELAATLDRLDAINDTCNKIEALMN